MSGRDELQKVIFGYFGPTYAINAYRTAEQQDQELAATIWAAGYRKPRTITTAEELDALPESAVVLDCFGTAWQKLGGDWVGWLDPGESSGWLVSGKRAPFRVLHEPEAAK